MVAGLAFLATAIATVFAQATGVRFTRKRTPHERAWTIALALFALASASLATGASTGWVGLSPTTTSSPVARVKSKIRCTIAPGTSG